MKSVPDVKDLRIYIASNLKWSKHISHICHQANLVSYRILKSFRNKNIWTFKKLFTTYIRPKLEFNTPVWSPFLLKDITHIERVQRHYTKVAFSRCGIPFVSYADRLNKINLSSLENRRKYFDMVLLFKMFHGLSDLDFHDYFQFHDTPYLLRSHSFQIKSKKGFLSSQWLNSFFNRAPKYWNSLPCDIVSTNSLSIFKSRMKSYKFHSWIFLSMYLYIVCIPNNFLVLHCECGFYYLRFFSIFCFLLVFLCVNCSAVDIFTHWLNNK